MKTLIDELKTAFAADDAAAVRALFGRHPELKSLLHQPVGPFDSPPITNVRSREMLDLLLEAGADINARSQWWAGGFGLLDSAEPVLAAYAIERGAVVDAHAAARLGLIDRLRELLTADPSLVHARGGDGQTPLHFAGTVEAAALLADSGADLDARDVDHESTPAQHMIRDRQTVVRYLISRGCSTDLLMASALGDLDLVKRHLDADPASVRQRVDAGSFPMTNPRAGGTIYQWTLGFHLSPHQVARKFGHPEVLALLLQRSPADVRLVHACCEGDEASARALLRDHPGIIDKMSDADRRQVADAARNNVTGAVGLMLECGWPVDARGQHRATPLHWAAFHGNASMAAAILRFQPPLEAVDADFAATPLGWAIHGSEHGWYCRTGDYGATVRLLMRAGATPPGGIGGSQAVRAALLQGASGSADAAE